MDDAELGKKRRRPLDWLPLELCVLRECISLQHASTLYSTDVLTFTNRNSLMTRKQ